MLDRVLFKQKSSIDFILLEMDVLGKLCEKALVLTEGAYKVIWLAFFWMYFCGWDKEVYCEVWRHNKTL